MGRPREHGESERAALLQAAAAIMGGEGAVAVTVRRVADQAGTSTRAVYSLFGDKDGLLSELFRIGWESMQRHHEAVPVQADPVQEILPLALAYRAGALEQPHLYEFALGSLSRASLAADDLAIAFRSFDRVLDALRRCADSGRFPGRDPLATGMQLLALVHGLASLELRGLLGDEKDALARWRDAVLAAVSGYTKPA